MIRGRRDQWRRKADDRRQGNIWVGNNFLVGAQNQSVLWSGNLSKFAPNGWALPPNTFGNAGGGLVGVGFGLAIDAKGQVWADSYAGQTIAVFGNDGRALAPEEGYNSVASRSGAVKLRQSRMFRLSGDPVIG